MKYVYSKILFQDLEDALLTDSTREIFWLQELIVRLLCGCYPNSEITSYNYEIFLQKLFAQKCNEQDCYNPFNTDKDFKLQAVKTKVDILQALCDFRLEADDINYLLKNSDASKFRLGPLGFDSSGSAYWYFQGTRLYREDRNMNDNEKSTWKVICMTENDWYQLARKLKASKISQNQELYRILNETILQEIPKLYKKEQNCTRKRFLCSLPLRTSARMHEVSMLNI